MSFLLNIVVPRRLTADAEPNLDEPNPDEPAAEESMVHWGANSTSSSPKEKESLERTRIFIQEKPIHDPNRNPSKGRLPKKDLADKPASVLWNRFLATPSPRPADKESIPSPSGLKRSQSSNDGFKKVWDAAPSSPLFDNVRSKLSKCTVSSSPPPSASLVKGISSPPLLGTSVPSSTEGSHGKKTSFKSKRPGGIVLSKPGEAASAASPTPKSLSSILKKSGQATPISGALDRAPKPLLRGAISVPSSPMKYHLAYGEGETPPTGTPLKQAETTASAPSSPFGYFLDYSDSSASETSNELSGTKKKTHARKKTSGRIPLSAGGRAPAKGASRLVSASAPSSPAPVREPDEEPVKKAHARTQTAMQLPRSKQQPANAPEELCPEEREALETQTLCMHLSTQLPRSKSEEQPSKKKAGGIAGSLPAKQDPNETFEPRGRISSMMSLTPARDEEKEPPKVAGKKSARRGSRSRSNSRSLTKDHQEVLNMSDIFKATGLW